MLNRAGARIESCRSWSPTGHDKEQIAGGGQIF